MPERLGVGSRTAVGIERIYRVVFGTDVNDVVSAQSGNALGCQIKRLGVNLAIDRQVKQKAKPSRVDVRGVKNRFCRVEPCP